VLYIFKPIGKNFIRRAPLLPILPLELFNTLPNYHVAVGTDVGCEHMRLELWGKIANKLLFLKAQDALTNSLLSGSLREKSLFSLAQRVLGI
jgi:hypothetical protein